MKLGLSDAISALRPNSSYILRGNTYSGLEWDSSNSDEKPTEEELDSKLTALKTTEKPMELLRKERNRRLQATDWRASSDLTLSGDWKAYRQDLRDIPAQQTPKLNSDGELDSTSISWPPEPSS